MKNFPLIVFILLISTGIYANPNGEDSKLISQALKISEPSAGSVAAEKEPEPKVDAEIEMTKTKNKAESDSSYYSVNKFNFLFYLMYKMKYTEGENNSKPTEKTILEE